jgi:predicted CoA-binding protein
VRAVPNLETIDGPVDIVDIFRRPEHVPAIVDAAIHIRARAVWMQFGVLHEEAAQRASTAGLQVITDRCIKVEHHRLVR